MKKVLSQLTTALLLAVSCFLVTGCGDTATPPADNGSETTTDTETTEEGSGTEEEAPAEGGSGGH